MGKLIIYLKFVISMKKAMWRTRGVIPAGIALSQSPSSPIYRYSTSMCFMRMRRTFPGIITRSKSQSRLFT
jgi:hypothetical protein